MADLLSKGSSISAVYSSDLKRALETAQTIASSCGVAEVWYPEIFSLTIPLLTWDISCFSWMHRHSLHKWGGIRRSLSWAIGSFHKNKIDNVTTSFGILTTCWCIVWSLTCPSCVDALIYLGYTRSGPEGKTSWRSSRSYIRWSIQAQVKHLSRMY